MAIDARAVTVTTTATRLDTASETDSVSGAAIAVYNNGAVTVYIGDSDVTTSTGFPLPSATSVSIEVDSQADALYGIVASGTCDTRVLEAGI